MRCLLLCFTVLALSPLGAARAQSCRSADKTSDYFVSDLRELTVSSRADDVYQRRDLKIPVTDSATVVLVTDNNVCQKVLATYNTTVKAGQSLATHVYVVKVATVYVALDPDRPASAAERYAVVNSKTYALLATYAR
jgi:hypothetical protein